jgi:uncharacterized protein
VSWDIWVIFLVLAVLVPWRGRVRLRQLLAKPQTTSAERISLYVATIVFQWAAVGVVAWRAWAHRFTPAQLGLSFGRPLLTLAIAIGGAAILSVLQWLNLRRMSRPGARVPEILRALSQRILPQSPLEAAVFMALAITAGICEEFLYRGFAIAVLSRASLPAWVVVGASAILFGLAHLYQGKGGLLGTTILGILFGMTRVSYGGLTPLILWHASIDIAAGFAGPKYLAASSVKAVES